MSRQAPGSVWLSGLDAVARAMVIVAALAAVGFCTWGLDRAFEITDESYYVLLAMHPGSVKLYVSAQQWVTGLIWPLTGTLALFRTAGLILLVASAWVLARGASAALALGSPGEPDTSLGRALVIAASITGALLYAATINLSPCYNLLASAGAYAAAGLVLLALHAQGSAKSHVLVLLAGFALGVEFVSKPSAGIATLCLVSAWILVLGRPTWRGRVALVLTTASALAFCVLLLAVTQTTFTDVSFALDEGFDLFRMVQTEPVGARLSRYVSEFSRHSTEAFRSFAFAVVCVLAYLATRRLWVAAIAIAALVYTYAASELYLGGVDRYATVTGSALVMFVLVLAVSWPAWWQQRKAVVIIAGLASLPYTVAVGTGNSIFTQVIDSLAPWGAALAAVVNLPFERRNDKILATMMLAVFVSGICLQIVTSGFRAPYHLHEPLFAQSRPVVIGRLGRVKVDAGTATFVAALDAAALECGIVRGTPFLGFYNAPGVALVLGGVPILTPWLNNVAQADAVLRLAPPDRSKPRVVAIGLSPDGSTPEIPAALVSFPAEFKFCGEATYPFFEQRIQIWSAL